MRQLAFIVVLVGVASCLPTYPYHNVYPDVYPVHPGGIGGIFKGPSSETIIKGPDGSVITSQQRGGLVAAKAEVVATAPIIASAPLVSLQQQPLLVARQPIVLQQPHPVVIAQPRPIIVDRVPDVIVAEQSPKIQAEHVLVGHKVITVPKQIKEDSDLVGPSGTISIRGDDAVISGPASLTVKGDGVVADISKEPITTIIKSVPVVAKTIVQDTIVIPAPAVFHDPLLTHSVASPAILSSPNVLVEGPSAPSAIIAGPSVGPALIAGPRVASAAIVGPRVAPALVAGPLHGYAHSAPVVSHNGLAHYRSIVRPDTILTGAYEASLALPAAAVPRDLVAATYGSSYLPHGNAAAYYAKPVYRGVL